MNILKELQTSPKGLNDFEVKKRIENYGKNELPEQKTENIFSIFINQFKSPLIYVLLGACVIVSLMGEWVDTIVIAIALILDAVVGTFQEGKARNTILALKNFVETKATVLRNGREVIIPDKEIVPGDVIILQEGEKIPADAKIILSNDLRVDEAVMTGESKPVYKNIEDDILKGTMVISGNAKAVVFATGKNTSIGKIAEKISEIDTEVPLKKNIKYLSKIIIRFVLFLALAIFIIGLWHNHSIKEMFLAIVSLSVSIIPEGLPVIITLILAMGVQRMGKRNALVKKLQAVEGLGQADIIAVDKTGTITKNELVVNKVFINNNFYEVEGIGYEPKGDIKLNHEYINPVDNPDLVYLAKLSSLCAEARTMFSEQNNVWHVSGDPTEAAILVFGQKIGFHKEELNKQYPKLEDNGFDYQKKYKSSFHEMDKKKMLVVMGAPEEVLEICTKMYKNGRNIAINKKEIQKNFEKMLNEGLRVIAVAQKDSNKFEELSFIGFLGMKDALRLEVADSVLKAQNAGIRVIMITGDHKITAKSIAKEAGIYFEGDKIITGPELDNMSDSEIAKEIDKISVFARVNPEHKLRIVNLFRSQDKKIAMTGDGVNDAPSLVAADLGISMGQKGTDVAKEASDIILLDDNFKTIVSAIEEGRGIYKSIKKVLLYLFSTGLAEVILILTALLLNMPLPLLAVQIIWLNFVTDGILDATLIFDPKEDNLMHKKFQKPNKWLIDKVMVQRLVILSLVMGIGTLLMFKQYYLVDMTRALTISLTVLAVFQWFNAWNCRSETKSIFNKDIFSNKFLVFGTIVVVLLQLTAVYNPFMQSILGTTALTIQEWGYIILIASSVIIVEEGRKFITRAT
ncbi:MAG: P-type Ca2+ transporter type [Patescibacteria group bacterium]|nr:P-type Ca2+ transporter type [Patescibacteria group bacterium]